MGGKINVKDLKVADLMSSPVICLSGLISIKDAINLLVKHRISGAPVIDSEGTVVSVVSEMDLMRLGALHGIDDMIISHIESLPKKEKLVTASAQAPFKDLFKLFLTNNVRRIIVLGSDGKAVGIVARRDIIKSYLVHHTK